MAGNSDWFSIGSTVSCRTCYSQEIEGEVLAFDPQTKMLILKCAASSNRQSLNDVHIVNLSLVSDVKVIQEVNSVNAEPQQSLNLQRLNNRIRNQIEEKKRMVMALQAGVSPEGQKLFVAIHKTIKDVSWDGVDIVVLNTVKIRPPYKVDNVHDFKACADSKALLHIKKVVEKHIKDTAVVSEPQQQSPSQREPQPQIQKGSSTQ